MYSVLPSFIPGFPGCDEKVANAVFAGRTALHPSDNDYDWLGAGIYFWESSPARALAYARLLRQRPVRTKGKVRKPAVVGAVIDPGYCLNLLDAKSLQLVSDTYEELRRAAEEAGVDLPKNRPVGPGNELLLRDLDCAVINMLHKLRAERAVRPFDTVRAAFIEGEPLYKNSGFRARNHIQLCVRNVRCIKGYFRPLDDVE